MIAALEKHTTDELLALYAQIGIDQDQAIDAGRNALFKRLFEEKRAIEQELRGRSGDERRFLARLYDHPNMQVRLNAAKATLALAPIEARRQLALIQESQHFPQAGDAGMCLWNLETGVFKPE